MTEVDVFHRWVILDSFGGVAIGDHPDVIAAIQVDGGNPSPWRLDQRQPLWPYVRTRGTFADAESGHSAGRIAGLTGRASAATPGYIAHIGSLGICHGECQIVGIGHRRNVEYAGFGIQCTSRPVSTARVIRKDQRAQFAVGIAHTRRQIERPGLILRGDFDGFRSQLRREIDQVAGGDALPVERRGPGGKWLGWGGSFAGHAGLGHRPLLDGPHRLAGDAVENECESLFCDLCDGLDPFSAHRNVGENWSRREVPVPKVVVNGLEVPNALPGPRVQTNQAVGKEIVAQPVCAVEIAGGHFHRDVHVAEFFITTERTPGAGVSGILPRVLLPRFVTQLTGVGNRSKGPDALAGAETPLGKYPRYED